MFREQLSHIGGVFAMNLFECAGWWFYFAVLAVILGVGIRQLQLGFRNLKLLKSQIKERQRHTDNKDRKND